MDYDLGGMAEQMRAVTSDDEFSLSAAEFADLIT